jgi:hypothetical protein
MLRMYRYCVPMKLIFDYISSDSSRYPGVLFCYQMKYGPDPVPDLGTKKAPDPGSGSATLVEKYEGNATVCYHQ